MIKKILLQFLDRFISRNPRFVFLVLDNAAGRNLFLWKYLRNRPAIFFSYFRWKPVRGNPKRILILKTDAIGDYLLFRNYLQEISDRFRPEGYKITLGGNLAWKELAEVLDAPFVDDFCWLNRGGMNRKPDAAQQLDFLLQLNQFSYKFLLYPNYSREWDAGDFFVPYVPAWQKFAFDGNSINQTSEQHAEANRFYSDLIEPEAVGKFDFFRNGELVAYLTGKKSGLKAPFISRKPQNMVVEGNYAVFFPGASLASRRWPKENFAELAGFIIEDLKYQIVLCGGPGEIELCSWIEKKHKADCINMAGKTSLIQFLDVIAGAKLVISNDTSAIHLGAQSGIPSVCLYKGNNYGRCMPYPKGTIKNLEICMPDRLQAFGPEERIGLFSENDGLEISEISTHQVWKAIQKLIYN